MNQQRFDCLTRLFARGPNRRELIGAAVATGFGFAVGPPLPITARNQRKRRNRKQHSPKCPNGAHCGNGGDCRNGRCDHNVCTLDCASTPGGASPQPCGPAGSSCQCVNRGEGVGACVKSVQGMPCSEAVCDAGELCGISCTTYLPSCWVPCV